MTAELGLEWQEALLDLSVETSIDIAFMGENFCGYNYDDTEGRCYRAATEIYLDASCEHPNANGHAAIANLMLGVIDE